MLSHLIFINNSEMDRWTFNTTSSQIRKLIQNLQVSSIHSYHYYITMEISWHSPKPGSVISALQIRVINHCLVIKPMSWIWIMHVLVKDWNWIKEYWIKTVISTASCRPIVYSSCVFVCVCTCIMGHNIKYNSHCGSKF